MAAKGGTSAMLEVLAQQVGGISEQIAEVRQDVKETRKDVQDVRERLAGLEKDVAHLKEEVAGLKARPSRMPNGWVKEAFDVVKMLVIALLAALGVTRYSG